MGTTLSFYFCKVSHIWKRYSFFSSLKVTLISKWCKNILVTSCVINSMHWKEIRVHSTYITGNSALKKSFYQEYNRSLQDRYSLKGPYLPSVLSMFRCLHYNVFKPSSTKNLYHIRKYFLSEFFVQYISFIVMKIRVETSLKCLKTNYF